MTEKTQSTQDIRRTVIEAALPDIAFDGWSVQTIENAAAKEGIDTLTVKAAFPGDITDILDAFAALADSRMLEALAGTNPEDLRVRDRIRTALIARFTYLEPHKEAVQASLKFWLNPLRKARATKIIWRTADHIWDWAGDTATDYNRYTKRGLLSSIIAPATLVWLNDHSEDMSKTTSFIDARIANIMSVSGLIGRLKSKAKG